MLEKLLEILQQDVLESDDPITSDSDLFALGLDSMAIMQLLLVLEDEFGVALDPTDLSRDHFQTPAKIIQLIESKRAS